MNIAVVGGTGTLGAAVVEELAAAGHEAFALSRRAGAGQGRHRAVDLRTGEGLHDALAGIDVVVDAANGPPSAKAAETLVEGTHRLLEAERDAGVAHHVGISIVGAERVPTAYYGVKVAQEEAVTRAPGWTIVRATQFHDLLDMVFSGIARYGVVPAPRGVLQPVDVRSVARLVAEVATGEPARDRVEIAGPAVEEIGRLARTWRAARRAKALVVPVPMKPAVGRALRAGGLTAPDAERRGDVGFAAWLGA